MAAEISDRARELTEARGPLESELFERHSNAGLNTCGGSRTRTVSDGELDREEASLPIV
jgi:hypothetical protein